MSKPRTGEAPAKPAIREHGTIELFEAYWVLGESTYTLLPDAASSSAHDLLERRGIPTRDLEDAQALARGDVALRDLWEDYLTEFQWNLAVELEALRYRTEEVGPDG